jgi:hypothetical protein
MVRLLRSATYTWRPVMTRLVKVVLLLGFAAVLAFVIGLLTFDAPFEYSLDCNRFSGSCLFTQRLLVSSRTGSVPIASLEGAQVRVAAARRGAPRIMVWVKGRGGTADAFFADYGSRAEADEAAGKIDAFLRDPSDGRLILTRSVRGMYWLAWALVPLVAGLVVALAAVLLRKPKRERSSGSQAPS